MKKICLLLACVLTSGCYCGHRYYEKSQPIEPQPAVSACTTPSCVTQPKVYVTTNYDVNRKIIPEVYDPQPMPPLKRYVVHHNYPKPQNAQPENYTFNLKELKAQNGDKSEPIVIRQTETIRISPNAPQKL